MLVGEDCTLVLHRPNIRANMYAPVPRQGGAFNILAGLLTSGSISPRTFPSPLMTVATPGFVPGYSGGTATDLHRFPLKAFARANTFNESLAFITFLGKKIAYNNLSKLDIFFQLC